MKFFIDTANLEQIQEAYDLGVLDGVTTNPSLWRKKALKVRRINVNITLKYVRLSMLT